MSDRIPVMEEGHVRQDGPAEVELASYLGDRYELRCRGDGASIPWVVYSDRRVGLGERITLHVEPDGLIVTAC